MDYSQEYFTIESLESGNTITLTIGSSVSTSDLSWIAWSKDKTNWTTTNNVDSQTVTITVSADIENVYFKGSGTRLANNYETTGANIRTSFSSTKTYNASGNIMSMLYSDSFSNKTSVSASYAFCGLFLTSTKLIDAQNLVIPITNVNQETTFCGTFNGCTGLVNPPQFSPVEVSGLRACMRMFYGCSSLLSTINFDNFTTISGNNVMFDMFHNCTSLVNIPRILMPTEVRQYSYGSMFAGCTSITESPVLPAKTLANNCYNNMFNGCTSLSEVTCLATDISATNCLTNWLNNVSSTGTFYKDASMTSFPSGTSGIPSNWNVDTANTLFFEGHYPDFVRLNGNLLDYVKVNGTNIVWRRHNSIEDYYRKQYFTVETLEANNYITLRIPAELTPQDLVSVSYSVDDGATWTTVSIDNTAKNVVVILQNVGDRAIFKGVGDRYSNYLNSALVGSSLIFSKNGKVYGNIMSLIDSESFVEDDSFDSSNNYVFAGLFKDNTHLVDASNLILPATTLAEACYYYMFSGCTSLIKSPKLPALVLVLKCYYYMFSGCSSLSEITCLAKDISASNSHTWWVDGVASSGTFYKESSMTSWPSGVNGIPTYWTVQNYS